MKLPWYMRFIFPDENNKDGHLNWFFPFLKYIFGSLDWSFVETFTSVAQILIFEKYLCISNMDFYIWQAKLTVRHSLLHSLPCPCVYVPPLQLCIRGTPRQQGWWWRRVKISRIYCYAQCAPPPLLRATIIHPFNAQNSFATQFSWNLSI
jgi:hypothetical protein